jgi:phage terminase large subunit-like protein
MLGPKAPSSAAERSRQERARDAADKYARMSKEERCVFAGEMLFRKTYARVTMPDRVDALLQCRVCDRKPSEVTLVTKFGSPLCTSGEACKPRNAVARTDQIPPWVADPELNSIRTWTALGGRGSGKSFTAGRWFIQDALRRPDYRMGILGPDFGISVGVGIVGPAGFKTVIEAFDDSLIHKHDEQKNVLYLANGSRIKSLSTENLKTIEGPEYHGYWCDELAELRGQGGENCVWKKRAEPGVRLVGANGEPVRRILTGTPDATPLIKHLHDETKKYPKAYYWTTLATSSNEANIDNVEQRYEEARGKDGELNRYGQAKLEGRLILESENALLNEEELASIRVDSSEDRHRSPDQMDKVVLAVDANHSEDKKSDECGIMVVGRRKTTDDSRIAHLFADASTPDGPKKWGERIIEALIAFPEIDEVVVEDDKSLVIEIVERVLREQLQRIGRPIKVVPIKHGNKSKKQRADPVAVEYQLGHVLHDFSPRMPSWTFTELEWQWVSWDPKDTGPKKKSPDRIDAIVYAIHYLLIQGRAPDTWHSATR